MQIIYQTFWTAIFVIVNTYNIIKIILERRPKMIPEEIRDLYGGILKVLLQVNSFILEYGYNQICNDKYLIRSGEHQKTFC